VKVQQLTKKDVVVLWGGSNDIARNNSLVGLKHILESLINANHTNVILLTAVKSLQAVSLCEILLPHTLLLHTKYCTYL
jgi:hypothetical protein